MKRLLAILGAVGLTATSASSVVSCDDGRTAHHFKSQVVSGETAGLTKGQYYFDVKFDEIVHINNDIDAPSPDDFSFTYTNVSDKALTGDPIRVPKSKVQELDKATKEKIEENAKDGSSTKTVIKVEVWIPIVYAYRQTVQIKPFIKGSKNLNSDTYATVEMPGLVQIEGKK